MRMTDWSIEPQGDRCLIVALGDRIDPQLNGRARAIAEDLLGAALAGVLDVVPAFSTIAVHYRPDAVARGAGEAPWRALERRIAEIVERSSARPGATGRLVEIPVCYDADFGPDTADVAAHCGLATDDVGRVHAATEHFVYMLGFAPGQPYIGGLDRRLGIPRRGTPRVRVPQGSVAIAHGMTAIYTLETPGGWSLIGRTPLQLFMPQSDPPCLLRAGDRVRFMPVTRTEFDRLLGRRS
jgi:inhibitor of KinA